MSDGPDERDHESDPLDATTDEPGNSDPESADDQSDLLGATDDQPENSDRKTPESEHRSGTGTAVSRDPTPNDGEPHPEHADERQRETGSPGRQIDPRAHTTDRRSLASDVQIQWGINMTITVVVLTVIATAILGGLDLDIRYGAVVLVAFFLLGTALVVARYRRWVYQVREDALYLERGVITHVRTLVPYVRIQHVDTSRGPLERVLGLSTLVVYTAGSRGADVSIPGLTPEQARDLQKRVKELAIEAEGDDAV